MNSGSKAGAKITVSVSMMMVATNALASISEKVSVSDEIAIDPLIEASIDAALKKKAIAEKVSSVFSIVANNIAFDDGMSLKDRYEAKGIDVLAAAWGSDDSVGGGAYMCYTNCHGACHSACHGSRSWR